MTVEMQPREEDRSLELYTQFADTIRQMLRLVGDVAKQNNLTADQLNELLLEVADVASGTANSSLSRDAKIEQMLGTSET